MTAIATDGRTMAGDGRINAAGLITNDEFEKVWHGPDGSVYGLSGDTAAMAVARQWVERGCDPDCVPKVPGNGFEGLRLKLDGAVDLFDGTFMFMPTRVPFALGCGADLALMAMTLGRSPSEAVKDAARLHSHVGGRVRDLRPKPKGAVS